tara:strand:+ start:1140 stop:1385 length:246 start_codon:yes stop_codon:yes gene_type:complete
MPRFVSGTNRQKMVADCRVVKLGLALDKVDRVKRSYPMTSLHRAPHSPHSTYPKGKLAVQVSDLLVKKALADLRMIPTSSC